MRVAFATSNPSKLREVRGILAPYGLEVTWERRRLPEPQADSLQEVVRTKLAALPDRPGAVLVEDSGIFLHGLGGFPGVYSRYVYETIGLAGILRLLEGQGRRATFRTVAGLRKGPTLALFEGRIGGTISRTPRGRHGFGYDPIFVPAGSRRTFGEMTPEEKRARSHRARAFRALGERLTRPQR